MLSIVCTHVVRCLPAYEMSHMLCLVKKIPTCKRSILANKIPTS